MSGIGGVSSSNLMSGMNLSSSPMSMSNSDSRMMSSSAMNMGMGSSSLGVSSPGMGISSSMMGSSGLGRSALDGMGRDYQLSGNGSRSFRDAYDVRSNDTFSSTALSSLSDTVLLGNVCQIGFYLSYCV